MSKKQDKRLELALTVYQILKDIHDNDMDCRASVVKRCDSLLDEVLTVLEELRVPWT